VGRLQEPAAAAQSAAASAASEFATAAAASFAESGTGAARILRVWELFVFY
jgi:hypothetical protein